MVYAVVGALCGVYGLFAVMVCCGSGKIKSKRDRDLEDREQLEFCRNFNKTQGKMKSKRDRDLEDREQLEFCRNFNKTQEKLKMEKESRMEAIQNTRKMIRSRGDNGQVEFLKNWKRKK